ncbi:hypothetical protein JMJ35_005696 [Cladonia borealis]|uniref:Uncharacterized protein n=1 Tax=Cladonia borealis TaxID=184061 RepID=A0AA39R0J7_9LECA|nr:hypothetical protein JMJ35_005696 [Cladonia borealis]
MKNSLASFIAGAGLIVASQAYIVNLNVYDNTCAYTIGFQSLELTTNGGALQQLTAYSRQACAGPTTYQGCAAGVDSMPLNVCYDTVDSAGGSNALSSYSSGGDCPN